MQRIDFLVMVFERWRKSWTAAGDLPDWVSDGETGGASLAAGRVGAEGMTGHFYGWRDAWNVLWLAALNWSQVLSRRLQI